MIVQRFKSFTVAAFSIFLMILSIPALADDGGGEKKEEGLDVGGEIFSHVKDGHEFHFFGASVPLPVILYSPEKGFTTFMSSAFHHGEHAHEGYLLLTEGSVDPFSSLRATNTLFSIAFFFFLIKLKKPAYSRFYFSPLY